MAKPKKPKKNKGNKKEAQNRMLDPSGGATSMKGLAGLPGWAPGSTFVPGSPGVPRPPIAPFMTGDQMRLDAEKKGAWRQAIIDIDTAISRLQAQNKVDQTELEKSRVESRDSVVNDRAASGFTGSSTTDADLFDIESTARMRREFLNTTMDTATKEAENRKSAIKDEQDAWQKALNQMMVENAAGMSTDLSPYTSEPTQGSWQPPSLGSNPNLTKPKKGQGQAPLGGSARHDDDRPNVATGRGRVKTRAR